MKNQDVLFYEVALDDVRLKGIDLTIIISRNRELAEQEAKHLRSSIEPPDEIKEYRKLLIGIQEKYAMRNAEGNIIMREVNAGGKMIEIPQIEGYDDPDGQYAKEFRELREQYNGQIKEYDMLVSEFKGKLGEENESFKPILISYDIIPKDIDSDNMNIIWNLIDKTTIPDHLMK